MWKRQYRITLQTPIGERYGRMSVNREDRRVEGLLSVLKKGAPFYGTVSENGTCRIWGELISLMQTIAYEGTGQIGEDFLHLTLKSGQNQFELFGKSMSDGGEDGT